MILIKKGLVRRLEWIRINIERESERPMKYGAIISRERKGGVMAKKKRKN